MNYPTAINHSQAIQLIESRSSAHQLESETILLAEAAGRVLSTSVLAPINVPEFNCSRMDGYAINLSQIEQQSFEDNCYRCALDEAIHAKAQRRLFECNNKAVPVMTGALLPVDCDAIIIKENAQRNANFIEFLELPIKGLYIREAGSDLQQGQVVVKANQALTAAHLGLLSSLGIVEVAVIKKPVVALFLTGDEIIQPGQPCKMGQFFDANTMMLKQLLINMGCEVKLFSAIKDDVEQVTKALGSTQINDCDVVITVGGVSMGDKDWIPQVVNGLGTIVFHKSKIRPGFPVLFAELNQTLFFGLPGNPVSSYTTLCQYVYIAVRSLQRQRVQHSSWSAEMSQGWQKKHDRREFLRGFYDVTESGQLRVKVCGQQQSSRIESLSEANCFIVLNESHQALKKGDYVSIEPFFQFKIT